MGFLHKIASRFKRAHIGHRIAKGASIGLRKVGNVIQKASSIASKVGPMLQMTGDPRLQALGGALSQGSAIGSQLGSISKTASTALKHAEKGDYKNALETSKNAKKQMENFKS